ncbi:hypothetical protein CUMW_166650 [Citrus unshiu]|uniref:Beta-carotene isomerase D27-like C-terminal domain-containing protein n=1 Tax=Citrus unshiu TaxID=55188 RepID=A0A2H5PTT2_CITUN|nr:hypothetical protein CUMW_166650 [Citrus unshiu]
MEAKLLPQTYRTPFISTVLAPRRHRVRITSCVVAVLARPAETRNAKPKQLERKAEVVQKTVYNDSWFDQIAINHLSQSVQDATGIKNNKGGYEGMVEAAKAVLRNFDQAQQRAIVIQALERAFPRPILTMATQVRAVLPESKLAREFFAVFTTIFFAWLVGPCEEVFYHLSFCKVRESEVNGKTEKNVVHIKKCRFLEESNCVGMCTNLCKMPSQTFIKDSLGMPVNMVPNFDDMSCEMIFGQEPLASSDDPAFKQPCYKLCKESRRHTLKCST